MTVSVWNLILNATDSLILVILIWLIVTHRTDIEHHVHKGGTMSSPHTEELNFIHRRGRFADIDEDTPERPQVIPGLPPPENGQTHTYLKAKEGYQDGAAEDMDT